jgi:hypothetical protein
MDAGWLNCLPSEKVLRPSYLIGAKENARLWKNILAIICRAISLIYTRGIVINSSQGTGPGRDRLRCNGEVRDRLEFVTPLIAGRLLRTFSKELIL